MGDKRSTNGTASDVVADWLTVKEKVHRAVVSIVTDPDGVLGLLTTAGIARVAGVHRDGVARHLSKSDVQGAAIDVALDPGDGEAGGAVAVQRALFVDAQIRLNDRSASGSTLADAIAETANEIGDATMLDPMFWRSMALAPLTRATNQRLADKIRVGLASLYQALDTSSESVVESFKAAHGDVLDLDHGLITVDEFCRAATAIMEASSKRASLDPNLLNEGERGRIMLALFLAMVRIRPQGPPPVDEPPHPFALYAEQVDEARRAT